MKKYTSIAAGLMLAMMSQMAYSASILRIVCDGKDADANIYLNERFMGKCPADIISPAGQVRLLLVKPEGMSERFEEKTLTVIDNAPQRLFIELTNKRPNIDAQLKAAEAGDVAAMRIMADYYERGYRVKKSAANAQHWRQKIEQAELAALRSKAEGDDMSAIKQLIAYYEAKPDVPAHAREAVRWREHLVALETQQTQAAKEADKERRIAELEKDKMFATNIFASIFFDGKSQDEGDVSSAITTVMVSLPILLVSIATDTISTTLNNMEIEKIRNEASVRPSSWAKPDSMIARAIPPQPLPAQ